jgi:Rps23 Pro-64 3,4-dihydroxylase Tpa1-like proline 4-hydroxylase
MASDLINIDNLESAFVNFNEGPFSHCVIDNFLHESVANKIAADFPAYDSGVYNGSYSNQIELKRTCNIWDRFPKSIYQLIDYLNSKKFAALLSQYTGTANLYTDSGIHGGGLHSHPQGGKLNPHLDYSLHPKLDLQRKYNLIIYLTPGWQASWGGDFSIWNSDSSGPTTLFKTVSPVFNRAIIFDTTQRTWHGLSTTVSCPINTFRNSIAMYYLTDPPVGVDTRSRALFAPTEDQKTDPNVLELIARRSIPNGTNVEEWNRS